MGKNIDLAKSVYELTEEYPELIDVMVQLGFSEISKKPMRLSVGKIMTIPKGSKIKSIPMEEIVQALVEHGFEVEGYGVPGEAAGHDASAPAADAEQEAAPLRSLSYRGIRYPRSPRKTKP